MHRANNVVIMQTEQLGRIETLEEKLLALEGRNQQLEYKLEEQDRIIANLMGDNLEHLQDNMCLTAHINSSQVLSRRWYILLLPQDYLLLPLREELLLEVVEWRRGAK